MPRDAPMLSRSTSLTGVGAGVGSAVGSAVGAAVLGGMHAVPSALALPTHNKHIVLPVVSAYVPLVQLLHCVVLV